MVISRLIRMVFEVRGDCTSMQCFCWECWKIHQSALQSAVSVMAFVGGKLMQCHTNRGHCCLTAGIKHLFFVYVRIPGCCFVFSFPFPPFRLAEFDGFVWILIWASIYQCSVFHILSANAVATHSIFFSSPIEIAPYYVFYEMQIKRIHFIKLQPNHL